MKRIFSLLLLFVALAFAQESPVVEAAADPVVAASVVREELAMRDSVMQIRDSLCKVEKDSLRSAIVVEQAKSTNWEQSYQVMKQNNEVCAKALGVAIEANEKNKDSAAEERKKAAVMGSSSFFGGVLVGALLFWLIFD